MTPKNPLGKTASAAIGSSKHPLGTTGKLVEQAKGTVALGKMVTGHVGRAAASMAAATASSVLGRATGRKPVNEPATTSSRAPRAESATTLRSVPDVNEPGHTPAENKGTGPVKPHGDPLRKRTPAAKAAKGPVAKKAVQAEPATRKAAAEKRAPKAAAKKGAAKKATAKKAAAKKTAAKKTTAKKTTAKKTAARKTAAKEAPVKKAAGATPEPKTPVGTTATASGDNPSTAEADLNQPGTEGIVEPPTAKAVAAEANTLRKAAEKNSG